MQTQPAGVYEMEYRRNEILDLIRTEGKVEVCFSATLRDVTDGEVLRPIIRVCAKSEHAAKREARLRLLALYPACKVTRLIARSTRYIL